MNISYVGGFIDADGTVNINSTCGLVSIGQRDPAILYEIQKYFALGKVKRYEKYGAYPFYRWEVKKREELLILLPVLISVLLIKTERAKLLLEYLNLGSWRGRSVPAKIKRQRRQLRVKMKKLIRPWTKESAT